MKDVQKRTGFSGNLAGTVLIQDLIIQKLKPRQYNTQMSDPKVELMLLCCKLLT